MSRFTIVTGDFVPTGGMDRANYALASFLARTGHTLELVTHRVAPDLAQLPGVHVNRVTKPLASYFLGKWPLWWAGKRSAQATRASGGRVIVNGGNCCFPDVNWVHYVHAAFRPDLPASRLRRLKSRLEHPLDLRAERAAVRAARVVVCNSQRTRQDLIEKLGLEPARTVSVYYGSDPERFRPASPDEREHLREHLGWPAERPVVMFIGALGDRRKGFDTLFDAWRRLCKSSPWDAVLVVVGHGSELPLWEGRTADAGMTQSIRFLGFRADVPELLRAADALVHPARYEAYGLGVHEALCCGLPALVSATAGVAERYPPELAELLLWDVEDSAALASRLRNWRENLAPFRERVRPFSDRLRARTWDDMGRDFLTAIGETLPP